MSALEEQFRESACYGDVDIMNSLLNAGVNVNSQNKMNGWTALHWACKRGNVKCKDLLLSWGADVEIKNNDGQIPLSLESTFPTKHSENEGFVPNYIQYPELNHKVEIKDGLEFVKQPEKGTETQQMLTANNLDRNVTEKQSACLRKNSDISSCPKSEPYDKCDVRVLKARVMKSNISDMPSTNHEANVSFQQKTIALSKKAVHLFRHDFIEVDIPLGDMTMSGVIRLILDEFQIAHPKNIDAHSVYVRKLPNTRLRRDVEIARLKDYEEIEIYFLDDLEDGNGL